MKRASQHQLIKCVLHPFRHGSGQIINYHELPLTEQHYVRIAPVQIMAGKSILKDAQRIIAFCMHLLIPEECVQALSLIGIYHYPISWRALSLKTLIAWYYSER